MFFEAPHFVLPMDGKSVFGFGFDLFQIVFNHYLWWKMNFLNQKQPQNSRSFVKSNKTADNNDALKVNVSKGSSINDVTVLVVGVKDFVRTVQGICNKTHDDVCGGGSWSKNVQDCMTSFMDDLNYYRTDMPKLLPSHLFLWLSDRFVIWKNNW